MKQKDKIIICGLRNTGKTTLFWQLQKILNWPTVSVSQFIRDYIRVQGWQRQPDLIEQNRQQIGIEINQRIDRLLQAENQVVIETRIYPYIAGDYPKTLKVLLQASESTRIKRNAHRENISLEKSANRLIKKENNWLKKMVDEFGRDDFFEPGHYDLVIETDGLNLEQIAELVVSEIG